METADSIGLQELLSALRRYAGLVVVCVLVVGGAAFAFARTRPKTYTATAAIVFENNPLSQQIVGLPASGGNLLVQQAGDVELVQLGDMAAKTAQLLGHGLTEAQVRSDLAINGIGESSSVSVAATSRSSVLAAAIANAYVQQFVLEQQGGNARYFGHALALVEHEIAALPARQRFGPAAVVLQNRAQTLRFLADLRYGNVQIAQTAVRPRSPSSPSPARDGALGAVLGLLLGLGLALLLDHRRRRRLLLEPGVLAEQLGTELLSVIPRRSALRFGELRPGEFFELAFARLQAFSSSAPPQVVMIVSPESDSATATVAAEVADAACRLGVRALLVEADLRQLELGSRLGIEPTDCPGLSQLLSGDCSLPEATRSLQLDAAPGTKLPPELDVVLGGAPVAVSPAELLGGSSLREVMAQLRSAYDLIVLAAPPLSYSPDAFPLLREVDGVVVAASLATTSRIAVEQLRATLIGAGTRLLGAIAFEAGVQPATGASYRRVTVSAARSRTAAPFAGTSLAARQFASPVEPA
jgi:Mrp family chromosome partitioning ATPase